MLENFLAPMPAIIDRLKAQVPGFEQVLDASEASIVPETQLRTPNAQVIYDGFVVPGSDAARAGQGKAQVVTQRWLILIAIKNAKDQRRKQDSLLAAGSLFVAVFRALAGWAPIVGAKALHLATPPIRPIYTAAFAYIPIAFEGGLVLTTE